MAMVGAFAGPADALQVAVLAYIIGGVMALLMLLCSGRRRDGWRNLVQIGKPLLLRSLGVPLQPVPLAPGASIGGVPYGLAVALATMVVVALAHR
jgi:prepilin peptidase CpaA